jgi:CheY-like chemotaxis protein
MKKLKSILIIDDDGDCSFFHERLMKKMGCAENIETVRDGKEGLTLLTANLQAGKPNPNLIFLDVNMPGMGGWDFLEEYQKNNQTEKDKTILILLTTSIRAEDAERAKKYPDISGYYKKYLSEKTLGEIFQKYFPENMK